MTFAASLPSRSPSFSMTRSSGQAMRQQSELGPTEVGERTYTFLTKLYPFKTAARVSADTGLSMSSVEKMLERRSAPGPKTWPVLATTYRSRFLAAVVPDLAEWLDPAIQAERLAQLQADHERIGREIEAMRR